MKMTKTLVFGCFLLKKTYLKISNAKNTRFRVYAALKKTLTLWC